MVIQCSQCQTRFKMADDKLKPGGIKVRCSRCQHVFKVFPPAPVPEETFAPPPPPPSAEESRVALPDLPLQWEEAGGVSEDPPPPPPAPSPGVPDDLFSEDLFPEDLDAPGFDGPESTASGVSISFDAPTDSETSFIEEDSEGNDEGTPFPEPEDDGSTDFSFQEQNEVGPVEFTFEEEDPFGEEESDFSWSDSSGPHSSEDFEFGDPSDGNPESEAFEFSDGFPEEDAADQPPPPPSQDDFEAPAPSLDLDLDQMGRKGHFGDSGLPNDAVAAEVRTKPLPVPAAKGRKSPLAGLILFILLLLLGISGVAGYFVWKGETLDIESMLARISGKTPPPAEAGEIGLSDLASFFVANREAGQLFVIRGKATNRYPETRSAIAVKGVLFDKKGAPLAQQTVFCGNPLATEELRQLPFAQIEERMNNQFGDSLSNLNVATGKAIPFVIVFRNLPAELSEFTTEVVDSRRGTKQE